MANCSSLLPSPLVGPVELYSSLGHWQTAVIVILAIHLLPVYVVTALCLHRLRSSSPPLHLPSPPPLHLLTLLPSSLITLATLGILLPSTGQYVEVGMEMVLCLALCQFLILSRLLCGGIEGIVARCHEAKLGLPLGSPPLICLLPLPRPPVTKTSLSLVMALPPLLLLYKTILLTVDLTYLAIGYTPSTNFLALDNLHNILSFPIGLLAIYAYTMFNVLMNDVLEGNSKRFLGIVLLLQFVLFDCLRLFFIFLTGTGMLTCVPPFLTQTLVAHSLKNYIKAFLATFIGLPYLSLCSPIAQGVSQAGSLVSGDSGRSMLGELGELGECSSPSSSPPPPPPPHHPHTPSLTPRPRSLV